MPTISIYGTHYRQLDTMMAPQKHPLISHQPFRFLFYVCYSLMVVLTLPYYLLIFHVPYMRPNRNWTARQTFTTRLLYPLLDAVARVGISQTLTLEPGEEGSRFQIIPVSPLDVYRGPLDSAAVKPTKTGGTWFPDVPGKDLEAKAVILYFHGGAFVQGDGRIKTSGCLIEHLLDHGTCDAALSVQYRLSGYEGRDPFPAALQDALSSYLFLLHDLQIPPRQVILAGDSAGGNLVIALLRYLSQYAADLDIPAPKCAVLLSPWVEPFYLNPVANPSYKTDILPTIYLRWGANSYAGRYPHIKNKPYVSPFGNPFPTTVPLFVNYGAAELFFDLIYQWAKEMSAVKGNMVEMNCEPDAVHDTFTLPRLMGFGPGASDVAEKIADFVRKS